MENERYIAGFRFERLLSKVYSASSVNANKSLLENALTMEQGKTYAKHLGSSEKQFFALQKKLIETLNKLQTKAPYSQSNEYFKNLVNYSEKSDSAAGLSEIVEKALLKASSLDNSGK
ncbi:hypothetical protein RM549_15550 [Salegentibacter sp. F188]|uniref:Uncharacterized protein n=1 Tax=Autumnicola patrickiae TaxID=3075591 RepID=A0ABU3E5K7_9FLAO|nr:hypothetical protein [Salegentibacter sp. F188]MDT0691210.1 hypothetical protein [Salegentibacter sp. F188]